MYFDLYVNWSFLETFGKYIKYKCGKYILTNSIFKICNNLSEQYILSQNMAVLVNIFGYILID